MIKKEWNEYKKYLDKASADNSRGLSDYELIKQTKSGFIKFCSYLMFLVVSIIIVCLGYFVFREQQWFLIYALSIVPLNMVLAFIIFKKRQILKNLLTLFELFEVQTMEELEKRLRETDQLK